MRNALIVVVVFFSALGLAFGQASVGSDVLKNAIARTDVPNMSVLEISDLELPTAVPVPYEVLGRAKGVQLREISEGLNGQEIVPSFPKKAYAPIDSYENRRIIKAYSYTYPKDGSDRRVEVWYTGGDWMQYGFVYIVINAGLDKNQVSTYFIRDLSTPKLENPEEEGNEAPKIDPFNSG